MGYVTYKNGRFEFYGRYEEKDLPKRAGFYWDPLAKCWWTKDIDRAQKLEKFFDPGAQKVFQKFIEERERAIQLSRAVEAQIDVPAPEGRQYMPFQLAGIQYIIENLKKQKGVILGDEMGLGKTVQALGVINALGLKRIFIICPASLKLNWAREAGRWLVEEIPIYIDQEPESQDKYIVITNYEKLDHFEPRECDLLIIDEAHYIKNRKAKRSQLAKKLAQAARNVLLLTGTPISNRPVELWNLLSTIGAEQAFGGFYRYAHRYCAAVETRWGWDFSGASNLEELQMKLRERWMIRRLKKDVLKELPPKIRQVLPIEARGRALDMIQKESHLIQLAREYNDLIAQIRAIEVLGLAQHEEEFKTMLKRLDAIRVSFSEISSLRKEIGLSKLDIITSHIENILDEENKVVIFAHHIDLVDRLKNALIQYGPVILTGRQNEKERQMAIDLFQQEGSTRVFIGTLQASGVGITLTAARTAVMAEIDWVPATIKQAEDRLHRIGQSEPVLVQYLVYNGSLEAYMAETIARKLDVLERALDAEKPEEIDNADSEPDLYVPVIPTTPYKPGKIPVPKEPIDSKTEEIARTALRFIASLDPDRARLRNAVGFSKFDSLAGKALAEIEKYTPEQAAWALKLAYRYRRQLPQEIKSGIEKAYRYYYLNEEE